jgi:AcrR family transcriptional regulator
MRLQDESKKAAIFNATVKLVNEIGFAAASVAKIAKEANVSPATIYIYYKNKEDLLVSIFLEIKQEKTFASIRGFDESSPLKESLRKFWHNSFKFVSQNGDLLGYHDQFLNSPYSELVADQLGEDGFQPFLSAFESAAKKKIIKKVHFDLLKAFILPPLSMLANSRTGADLKMTRKNVESAFEMAWDAISLDRN